MRMKMRNNAPAARRATNLNLSAALVAEAQELGVGLSGAAERGIAAAIAEERARRWRAENADALASSNAYVEAKGLPLGRFRQF